MAADGESVPTEERVRRQVGRALFNFVFFAILAIAISGWAYLGVYQLDPGEAAVIVRLGAYQRTEASPGLKVHWPPPIERHVVVPVSTIHQEEFGYQGASTEAVSVEDLATGTMQTRDNNIVHLGFVVQYRVKDAFESRFQVEDPSSILADAAQAAIREVVGRTTIDEVLTEARGPVEVESKEVLQDILDRYSSGLVVQAFELQEVQPPEGVRDAFDDVLAALQDKSRLQREAEGHANEVVPNARASAVELREEALAYRDSKIAQATGEADRFEALVVEYRKAPEVTRRRLYLETMELVLPNVEKVIIEPGTASVLPYLPLGRNGRAATP